MNAHVLSLASLYHQGCDILFFTFPHHGPRAERKDLFSGIGLFGRGLLSFTEMDVAELRGLIAVHNPLTYRPKMAGKRVLIIGGAGDRFTLPRHLRLLQQHWPGSQLHWFPGSHLFHLGRAEYLKQMRTLMGRCTGQ